MPAIKVHRTWTNGGSYVQSVRFVKEYYTEKDAREYCKNNEVDGHKIFTDGLDERPNEYHFRQYDPNYDKYNYFVDRKNKSIYYVIGTPK